MSHATPEETTIFLSRKAQFKKGLSSEMKWWHA